MHAFCFEQKCFALHIILYSVLDESFVFKFSNFIEHFTLEKSPFTCKIYSFYALNKQVTFTSLMHVISYVIISLWIVTIFQGLQDLENIENNKL